MQGTTTEDRENELRQLLSQIAAYPERDWTTARARVNVLKHRPSSDTSHWPWG